MQMTLKHTSPDGLLREFTELLSEKMGLHYPKERWNDLEKKLFPLMRSLGFKDVTPCIEWLRDHLSYEQQIADLAYYLTIGETYFFRDARLFSALEKQVLPSIIHRRHHERSLAIWSAGCCSGEETYSLAILLHRLLPDIQKWNIRLIGSDINQEFLRKAELGRYNRWSFRNTPKEILTTYFDKRPDGAYQIIPEIQQLVSFRCANLVDDDRPETSYFRNEMDLVICNNVLIYFSQKQIDRTIHRLVQAIVKDGWLTVTPIEAPFVNHPQLIHRPIAEAIFFQKSAALSPRDLPRPIEAPAKNSPLIADKNTILLKVVLPAFLNPTEPVLEYAFTKQNIPTPPTPATTPAIALSPSRDVYALYEAKRYSEVIARLLPALQILRTHPEQLAAQLPDLILLIRTYSNQGDVDPALEWCEIALRADKLNPIVQYLKAEIKTAYNDINGALDCLQKTLFLEPDFLAALYLYGQLEQKCGHTDNAAKAYNRALKLIDAYPPEDPLPGTEELIASQVKAHLISCLGRG